MKKQHREEAVIDYVSVENFRGGKEGEPNTVNMGMKMGGCHQGFGGLSLPDKKLQDAFLETVMMVFGVTKPSDLVGKRCYVLRAFSGWNEPIAGLESLDGKKRMTINGFRKAMGFEVDNRFKEEEKSLRQDILRYKERIESARHRLKTMDDDYVEWD